MYETTMESKRTKYIPAIPRYVIEAYNAIFDLTKISRERKFEPTEKNLKLLQTYLNSSNPRNETDEASRRMFRYMCSRNDQILKVVTRDSKFRALVLWLGVRSIVSKFGLYHQVFIYFDNETGSFVVEKYNPNRRLPKEESDPEEEPKPKSKSKSKSKKEESEPEEEEPKPKSKSKSRSKKEESEPEEPEPKPKSKPAKSKPEPEPEPEPEEESEAEETEPKKEEPESDDDIQNIDKALELMKTVKSSK